MDNQNNQDNWRYNNQYNSPYGNPSQRQQNTFITMALVFGLLAFFSSMFVITPFIFGGLSIIFAILSKTSKQKMAASAIAGIAASIAGMACTVCMVGIVYYMLFNVPEYRELINKQYEQMYGQSFDEMLEDMENGTFDPNSLQPK